MVVAHPASEVTFFTSLIANFTKPRCQVGGFFHTSTVRSHERIITHHLVDHDWPDSQTRIATSTGMEYALCNIWYEDTTNNINIFLLKLFQLSTTANHLESTSQVLKVYCLICHLSHILIYLLTEDAYEIVYTRSYQQKNTNPIYSSSYLVSTSMWKKTWVHILHDVHQLMHQHHCLN